MNYERLTDEERQIIALQLGREPRGVLGISCVCHHGFPQVIVNRPVSTDLAEVRVFPTLFWLTCPYLRKEVAQLEGQGLIGEFEKRIQTDPLFAEQVKENHLSYAKMRLDLIPDEVQARLKEDYPERYKVLSETGVGGVRNLEGVKCLHMHLADYLARGENVIGAEVIRLLNKPLYCEDGQCAKEL
ncbi:MAG: DUF501 domain-containing protein [Firmicutes bacterium]|nr:DUF501 domain-containing protein [Bacillota bacterium]